MAYVYDPEEELKLQQQQGGQGTPLPSSGAGGELLGAGAPAAPEPAAGAPKPPSSSGWTNLRSYLDANKDQGMDLSNKVAGNIVSQGDAAKAAVDKGVSDYNAQLANSAPPPNVSDLLSRASSNPAEFVKNPGDVESFKTLRSGSYSGPGKFEAMPGYGDVAKKADEGTNLAKMVDSEGGQQDLIRSLNPNMGGGQLSLNHLLLAGDPLTRENLIKSAQPYANLRSSLDESTKTADTARDKAAADFATGQGRVQNEFVTPQTKSLTDLQADINSKASAASSDQFNKDQVISDLEKYIGGGGPMSQEEIAKFFPKGMPSVGGTAYDETRLTNDLWNKLTSYGNSAGGVSGATLRQYQTDILNNLLRGGAQPNLPAGLRDSIQDLKNRLGSYQYGTSKSMLDKIRDEKTPNWLGQYFPGTTHSSGGVSPATISSPEMVAKILALQNLIGNVSPYFKEEDLPLAGTYRPPSISGFKY